MLAQHLIFALFRIFIIAFIVLGVSQAVLAKDIVRMNKSYIANDLRFVYKHTVLNEALEQTVEQFGAYDIKLVDIHTTASRALSEIVSGENINLFIGVTSKDWEHKSKVIRIPIRRGILNYRLLAINKNSVNKFSTIKTLKELRKLGAGMRVGLVTTGVFERAKIKHFKLESLDGLYNMLNKNVIDYIPRGINEIYDEIALRDIDNVIIEPNLVICMPAPTYIIVSPNEERLANRIQTGLEKMVSSGRLKALFYEFFGDNLKRANLQNRTPIYIANDELPTLPFYRQELWFNNDKEQSGLGCGEYTQ